MSLLLQHFKRFGKLPLLFKENVYPVVSGETAKVSFKLPPEKALDYLRNKGKNIITTSSWNEIEANAYAKSFTVAKVMSADVVQEVFDYVLKAKEEGWSLKTFQDNVENDGLLERMQQAGWTGKDASRLKVIYDTNMKMAAAKGKYDGLKLIADVKPFWVYKQVERKTKRHDHSTFHNKKFRHDDPIWTIIFPPSAFGCSCHVVATTDGSGVESGSDYLDKVADSKDYTLSPLKQFEPDYDKYHSQIAEQLKSILDSRAKAKGIETIEIESPLNEVYDNAIKNGKYNTSESFDYFEQILKTDRSEYLKSLDKKTNLALEEFMHDGYKEMNKSIQLGSLNEDVKQIIDNDIGYSLKNDLTVFRGEKFKTSTNDLLSDRLTEISGASFYTNGLFSASCNIDKTKYFSKFSELNYHSIVFVIKLKKGTMVGFGTEFESELIFNPETKFKANKITKFKTEYNDLEKIFIELEVVP